MKKVLPFMMIQKKETKYFTSYLNKVQIGMLLGLVVGYKIGKKITIGIKPYIGKGFNKLDSRNSQSGQLSAGIGLGLHYKI